MRPTVTAPGQSGARDRRPRAPNTPSASARETTSFHTTPRTEQGGLTSAIPPIGGRSSHQSEHSHPADSDERPDMLRRAKKSATRRQLRGEGARQQEATPESEHSHPEDERPEHFDVPSNPNDTSHRKGRKAQASTRRQRKEKGGTRSHRAGTEHRERDPGEGRAGRHRQPTPGVPGRESVRHERSATPLGVRVP